MKERISSLQIGAITWNLVLSAYIGIVPTILFYKLKQDSWLAVLLTFILGIVIVCTYLYIWEKMPDKNIFQKINCIFGNKIGAIINFFITITNIFMTVIYCYSMINFITSQYLIKTPNTFIIIIFAIPVVYLITQKLEVIGRVFFIFWIMSLLLFLMTFIGLIFQLDFNNLLPILENGINPVIQGSLLIMPYTSFILFLFLSIPKNAIIDKEKVNKRVLIFYSLAFFSMFTGVIFITATLSGDLAKIYQFVEYQVLKRVALIGFIERVESTLSMRWILYIFATTIMGLYFTKKYIIHSFKIKKHEKLIISMIAVISLLLSNWIFPNNTIANKIVMNIIPYILYIFYLLLPIIIAIGLKLKTKKVKR